MRRFALAALLAALPLRSAAALQTFTLPNGLRVLLLEDHATPLVRASLRVVWEAAEDPPDKEGLGVFLCTVLEQTGPSFQSRSAFDRAVAASGVRLGFHPSPGRLEWRVSARSADQEAALQAIARLVLRPGLEGPKVEARRMNTWRALEAVPPAEHVRNRFLASLQGFTPLEGTALNRLSLADLEAFHHRIIRPERAVLGLLGDLTLAQAKALALLQLGAWNPAPLAPSPLITPSPSLLSHPEGSPEVWLGAALQAATPKALAVAELLARILETQPDSPLVRDPQGSCYLLSRASAAQPEALLPALQGLRTRWEGLAINLTPEALAIARRRWLQEEDLLPLNPGRLLDRCLDRSLGRAPLSEAVQAVTLAEVQLLLTASLAGPRLLFMGLPKRTLAGWLREAPALAPWAQDSTTTPKREAKSK